MKASHLLLAVGLSFGLMVPAAAMAQPVPPECRQGNGKIKCDKPGCHKFCDDDRHPGKGHNNHAKPGPKPGPQHAAPHPGPKPGPQHAAPHPGPKHDAKHQQNCRQCDDVMKHCKGPKSVCMTQKKYCERVCR